MEYLHTMISSKKLVLEPTAGVNETKICPKTAGKFLRFSEKTYLGTMISSKKKSGLRTNRWSD